ncbi:DNA polymerase III subunit delta [Conexibacter sp. DBS9H8]|uniref:DNA polymerase III subunit delta n=1 Tax=Conexibacter sp. DBS9H8 TaxID=2937801 RepID=UPI00200BE911|nr:DNA polymerase III subunit delta [Conexibacter sp. DBS9H8]
MAATFKPAYLIHGDDHGRIAERRARLRALAEAQSGVQGLELFEGERSTPEAVAAALNALTFALGRRFLIVDGVERWKERELEPLLAALADPPPDTTVSFFAREDGRFKAPKGLHTAVSRAGGDIASEGAVKPWELPNWVVARARELGLELSGDAARALVAASGDRQQRLLRELETLELALRGSAGSADASIDVDVETVTEQAAASSERRVWALADELLSGDPARAARMFFTLRSQGERVGGMLFSLSARLRDAHRVAAALERGAAPAEAKAGLRMPPRAQDQLLNQARRIGTERLRRAVETVAELEAASHGGGSGGATEETRTLRLIADFGG